MAKKRAKVKSKKAKAKKIIKRPKSKVKSKAKRRPAAKKTKKTQVAPEASLEKVGEITHYFPHVNAAAVKLLKSGLKVGDSVYIKGHTTDFKEVVNSIQLDHTTIIEGKKGQEIGLLVKSRVRLGDKVYNI